MIWALIAVPLLIAATAYPIINYKRADKIFKSAFSPYKSVSINLREKSINNLAVKGDGFSQFLKQNIDMIRSKSSEKLTLVADDGAILLADFIKSEITSSKTIIFVHGFHSSPYLDLSPIINSALENGYNALLICQRAHGESGGNYIGFGVKERQDVIKWAKKLSEIPQGKEVALYGISMGAASVFMAACSVPSNVFAIIGESGYTSPYECFLSIAKVNAISKLFILNFLRRIVKNRAGYDIKKSSCDSLKRSKAPVLMIYGDADKAVPEKFGQKNYAACSEPKEYFLVNGAFHMQCNFKAGEDYNKEVFEFLEKYVSST